MAWGSTVPATLAALTTALQSALTVPVRNGVGVEQPDVLDYIVIGYSSPTNVLVVEGTFAVDGLAVNPDREQYRIHNAATVVRGSADILDAQAGVFTLLSAVGAALAANPTLGGAVMLANLGNYALSQVQDSSGSRAVLEFDVEIDAYTTV
jgi:hypothetical protein